MTNDGFAEVIFLFDFGEDVIEGNEPPEFGDIVICRAYHQVGVRDSRPNQVAVVPAAVNQEVLI
ncbi:hypothetical protein D3C78_1079600 [compost metagenome]